MRNINLANLEIFRLISVGDCYAFCADENCIFLYYEGRIFKCLETNDNSCIEIYNLFELYPDLGHNELPKSLTINYSYDKKSIFLILDSGDILVINITDEGMCNTACNVACITDGIKACKWSPGNDVVALVSGSDIVIVMSNDFEVVSETELHGGGFGEKQFTTVGWGKKETQFRGSEGKYIPQTDSYKNNFEVDNGVRISWRGDAEYFVVSSLKPGERERYLRIFSKDGILQYTSEILPGLGRTIDWKPSGSLIACTQRLPNKYNVCFFEKNGLKHGEFTLPFKQNEVSVRELLWNQDSKLLALLMEKHSSAGTFIDNPKSYEEKSNGEKFILIYFCNNYHWYCKYYIQCSGHHSVKLKWDHNTFYLLHVLMKKGNDLFHFKYTWMWAVQKTKGADAAVVAVIDGCKLLLTSFKYGIVPPPMSNYSLEMSCQINQVGFVEENNDTEVSSSDLFVQLCDGQIYFYNIQYNMEKMTHELIGKFSPGAQFFYNIHWVSFNTISFCELYYNSTEPQYFLNILDNIEFDSHKTYDQKKYPLNSSVAILRSVSNKYILMHDNVGKTYLFDRNKEEMSHLYSSLEARFIELEGIHVNGELMTFGLDNSSKFYINEKMIANNVTSFHIHGNFLLLTNVKHRLLCIPLESEEGKNMIETDIDEVSTRKIESGSRLITSVPNDTKVILQMPRGNLECIQPRALSFSVIGKYLDELNYYNAFKIMRLQRINLNLLYDHNPNLFKENVHVFIDQIKDPNWISLFLSELVDEDVTETMYSIIYKRHIRHNETSISKCTVICELFEKALGDAKYFDKYFLPILTTYIKRGESKYIESALIKIKKLKEQENKGQKPTITFDEAFRYMLYLINVEDLYKVALGMYDFDLVVLVATKSQKDPKEYIPFLNELKKLEINYQKFVIDKYLKRYEKALKHLLQCGGDDFFTECLAFIKSHKLYKTALKLVPHTTDRYKQICSNYADELLDSHLYEEAGIMYSKAGSYINAISAFMKSGNWQELISCSSKLNSTNQELFNTLAGELLQRKKFKEASIVFMDYLRNTEMGLEALCSGKMFAEAFRIAELLRRDDLVQKCIKPNVINCYRETKLQISSFCELFMAQAKRLAVVREKKLLQRRETEKELEMNSEQGDESSEYSSIVTQSYASTRTTNRTFRSAKNKRKQERKLLSLKEGSPYEDLALITSLHNIVSNCLEMRSEVREINKILVQINEVTLAEDLQKSLEKLLEDIENFKMKIWTPDLLMKNQTYGPDATSNSIASSFLQSENYIPTNLINPRFLLPPETQCIKWKLEILNT